MTAESILRELREAIVDGEIDEARHAAEAAIKLDVVASVALNAASEAMITTGHRFETGEYYVADLIASAEALKSALAVLEPLIAASKTPTIGKVILGSVQGDVHDIGKNLVGTVMRTAGFEVFDLGINVSATRFVDQAVALGADIVGASAYSSTAMACQRDVLTELAKRGLRHKVIYMVGGAPTNAEWAKMIGADGWAPDAWEATKTAALLLERRRCQLP